MKQPGEESVAPYLSLVTPHITSRHVRLLRQRNNPKTFAHNSNAMWLLSPRAALGSRLQPQKASQLRGATTWLSPTAPPTRRIHGCSDIVQARDPYSRNPIWSTCRLGSANAFQSQQSSILCAWGGVLQWGMRLRKQDGWFVERGRQGGLTLRVPFTTLSVANI